MDNNYFAAVLFFLPAGIANAAPVIANKVPIINQWKTPVDFGLSWRGKRLTGDNKTWRGVVVGSVLAMITAIIISKLVPETIVNSAIPLTGFLLGFGALAGDFVESFIKRQMDIKPGSSWFPWDQLDYIIGALLFTRWVAPLPGWTITTIVVFYFVLHLVASYIGYKLKLKPTPI